MGDFVGPILEVVESICSPVHKYLNYHRKFNKYVDDFREAQADLQARKEDGQQKLQEELHFRKKRKREVENWFKKVEEKFTRAQGVEDKIRSGKYLFRSYLGKLADEATQEIREIHAQVDFSGGLVIDDPSATELTLPVEELVGAVKVNEIYEYLTRDEVRKIGVWGMGGIGKTTIMKHVHNKLLEETKFGKLIWTTISQDFDVRRLQQQIASQLKETLSDHEDTTVRSAKLLAMLRKQGRYVLILDDVWSNFSLNDVGIPDEPAADNGCKLVLTTRSAEVVRSMGCKEVQVTRLSMDQAMQLFRSKVGQDMLLNPKIESTMKRIVEECAGLPLAVVTVAGTLKGISDSLMWENALKSLKGLTGNIKYVKDRVFGCLIFSYQHLEKSEQDCFLWGALYPEDYQFQKEEIIEHCIEDSLIDQMESRKEMHDVGYVILRKLEENCLLERVENGDGMKMHDVVRDMALYMTAKRFLVKTGQQLKELPNEEEWSEDLEKVSLMRNKISTIPQNMKSPKFQKLTTLLLSENPLEQIPESFFEHFPNLKILDLSYNPILNLPNSISNLEKLTALLLRGCRRLKRCPSLSKLQALKKLDLEECHMIREAPEGLEMLVNLRYLSVEFINIPNGLLSKLSRLQYLAILSPTKAEEMRALHKLEVFQGPFFNVCDFNICVSHGKKLHKYLIWVCPQSVSCRNICMIHNSICELRPYCKKVELHDFDDNCGIIDVPCDIQQLEVVKANNEGSLMDFCRGLKDATDLKECVVEDCPNLESIFSSKCRPLETLETLLPIDIKVLKTIVGEPSTSTFSSLKEVCLDRCGKIKNLFPAKWVLHNLEGIIIRNCYEMEEIIESRQKERAPSNILFPN